MDQFTNVSLQCHKAISKIKDELTEIEKKMIELNVDETKEDIKSRFKRHFRVNSQPSSIKERFAIILYIYKNVCANLLYKQN